MISTGVVGIFLLMIIFRVKIMPTWIYDEAKKDWETQHQADTARINELMAAQKTSTELYIEKIMPTMVSALDINREYLDMRRTDAAERQAFQRTEMDRMRNRREGDSHDG